MFGPKLVATRGFFEDRALESRCFTEAMGQTQLRQDIPINLDASHKEEALLLRNQLLLFRFRKLQSCHVTEAMVDRAIEPRLSQIFVPLLSIIEDAGAREELRDLARQYNRELIAERGTDAEAHVLEILRDMLASPFGTQLSVKGITSWFIDRHGQDYEKKITTKWIGWLIRKKLGLKTQRSEQGDTIPASETEKLERLYGRYGLGEREEQNAEPITQEPRLNV